MSSNNNNKPTTCGLHSNVDHQNVVRVDYLSFGRPRPQLQPFEKPQRIYTRPSPAARTLEKRKQFNDAPTSGDLKQAGKKAEKKAKKLERKEMLAEREEPVLPKFSKGMTDKKEKEFKNEWMKKDMKEKREKGRKEKEAGWVWE